MKAALTISTFRMVEIYEEMISLRRGYCAESQFFRMTDFWSWLCEESETWRIKRFRSNLGENYERKANVVTFRDSTILTVSAELWERAEKGCSFANFILAHELGHLALGHHAKRLVMKHYQLFSGPNGDKANVPPTVEELETNFAGVFFQCGVALTDQRWTSVQLAKRDFSNVEHIKKAQAFVNLDIFKKELNKPKPVYPREVL